VIVYAYLILSANLLVIFISCNKLFKWRSFNESSLLDLDVFASIGVNFNVARLEDSSSIDGVESLANQFSWDAHFTKFIYFFSFRNIFFELICLFTQFPSFSHTACFFFLLQLFLFDLLCLYTLFNFNFFLLYSLFDFFDIMKLLPKLLLLYSIPSCNLGLSFLFVSIANSYLR
jgi:hypothetical protein